MFCLGCISCCRFPLIFFMKCLPFLISISFLLWLFFCSYLSCFGVSDNICSSSIGNWQPTLPSWEKRFVTVVGSVPWRKVLENKRFIHLYENVLKWNDSAVEEAFRDAKNRFWAELNSLPCDVSLPDPDIYIDKIDWDASVDPKLLSDLEDEFAVPDDWRKGDEDVIIGKPLDPGHWVYSTGWGDAEEDLKKMTDSPRNHWELNSVQANEAIKVSGWGDAKDDLKQMTNSAVENISNQWELSGAQVNGAVKATGWGDGEEDYKKITNSPLENNSHPWELNCAQANAALKAKDSWCVNKGNEGQVFDWSKGWNNQWENNNYSCDPKYGRNAGVWDRWDGNYRNCENSGRYMSRYKTSRFHGDGRGTDREWRNGNGRMRENFVYERSLTDRRPVSRQWDSR